MVYLISYDLHNSGQNYEKVEQAIKNCSYQNIWMHFLSTTWLIKSTLSVDQIYNEIKKVTNENDRFIIIEVKNNSQGWLDKKYWDYYPNLFT